MDDRDADVGMRLPVSQDALRFVILLGVTSLFADMTYEGARSITGPYLGLLGATASAVGVISGFGELIGYALRFVSGLVADRTGRYWSITLLGYAINVLAVPLLALAGHWPIAAGLIILERLGKAVRTPARDAMLSHATQQIGRGWGFGLHEALDQVGAVLGPLIVIAVLYAQGSYEESFAVLLIPAVLTIGVLLVARTRYPYPRELETKVGELEPKELPRRFWLYLAACMFIGAGYADFPLIAFHLGQFSAVPDHWIPIFYAVAMGVDALAALLAGGLYDRKGVAILAVAVLISAMFAPLVFLGGFHLALVGAALWGLGMGAQESVMRAAIADMVPANRRGSAYGIFNATYGIFWFLGSALMGFLYDTSLLALIGFSVGMQLVAVPLLIGILIYDRK
jgi:MFS family permease